MNDSQGQLTEQQNKTRIMMILLAFGIFSILLIGAFWFFLSPGQTVNLAFAYVVGLSMIVLPCTLPLAFVIVPLAMKQNPKKGLIMALLFGLGLSVTLSLYGVFVALIGKAIGLDAAIEQAGPLSRVLFVVGGLAAFVFGLSELKLIKFKIPGFSGSHPDWVIKHGDYLKAFFLGMFLGNAGVGCPNPLFYVLLGDIAVVGSVANGWWLGFIHGVGRATPLIFLTILGILGVNAVGKIATKGAVVKKVSGIVLIILGAFIIISGTSHKWYEESVVHKGWNRIVNTVAGDQVAEIMDHDEGVDLPKDHPDIEVQDLEKHEHSDGVPVDHGHILVDDAKSDAHAEEEPGDWIPAPWPPFVLAFLIFIPLFWYKIKKE